MRALWVYLQAAKDEIQVQKAEMQQKLESTILEAEKIKQIAGGQSADRAVTKLALMGARTRRDKAVHRGKFLGDVLQQLRDDFR